MSVRYSLYERKGQRHLVRVPDRVLDVVHLQRGTRALLVATIVDTDTRRKMKKSAAACAVLTRPLRSSMP